MSGRGKEPQMFYPLERFERVLNKQRMLKVPVEPFTLPPHEIHAVPLRFISEKVFDIPPGGYAVDIELTDTNDTRYTSRVKIRVDSKIKYRHDEAWQGS
ncbi:MAG: hypothetical protein LV481_16940 [Methylacidiphilales bacterium]|nr:hypothetical protein [Candidatus Methylacidiphilales bacterium]